MPWYDPFDDDDAADHFTGDGGESDQRLQEYLTGVRDTLRTRRPKFKTSTYDPNSARAKLGEAAEIIVRRELRVIVAQLDLDMEVNFWRDEFKSSPMGGGMYAIENSKNGDIYAGKFSIEVKASDKYDSVCIDESEVRNSNAKYLVCVTTFGLWATTMECARNVAKQRENATGTFWTVSPHDVELVKLVDLVNDAASIKRGDRW